MTRAQYEKGVSTAIASTDKIIFNIGINAAPTTEADRHLIHEPLWDSFLARYGYHDESMHISELIERLSDEE